MSVVVEVRRLTKSYGTARALDEANMTLQAGSIHALLGENGAGKSTLVKALTGVHRADSGHILVRGEEVSFARPIEASHAGIGVVHQERNVVPGFTVAENICLQEPPSRFGLVDRKRQREVAQEALDRLGVAIEPTALVSDCSVAQVQLIEIAKALAFRSDVLILDEPTSSLTESETGLLFTVLRSLRDAGASIVLVSHKLEEVFELCDTVTVLRDGRSVVESEPLANYRQREIVDVMVGRALAQREPRLRKVDRSGTSALTFEDVRTVFGHKNITFDVHPGEVFGLYGLVGAGRTELARSTIGLHQVTGGRLLLNGEPITIRSVKEAVHRYGIGYLSEDRKGDGVFLRLPIRRNVAVTRWRQISNWFGVRSGAETSIAQRFIESLGIRTRGADQMVDELSGGNQQKVSVAKWLASESTVLFIDEPTVGVDVRTKDELHHLVLDLAEEGTAVILISSDLPEMVALADRIGVMDDFRLLDTIVNTKDYQSMSKKILGVIHDTEHERETTPAEVEHVAD
ncbi:sugar ABC transporter ATP-binding protein [Pseudactinotalea sp. Z1748]|uniref:sugar ABC transporter ATP-binding protein n=1 Tax=Pseudactinotalea sp. Z1748 TaxID=3413027 RepID=UPI003C7A090F